MPELNEPQRQAVAHLKGPLIVFAGAGSGKTRTITYRIANLLATQGVAPYRILAVTFTNKAAGEMRERIEKLTGPEVTRDLWLGTFHSVCARLLRRYHRSAGLGRNFVIYDDGDQKALLTRVLKELGLNDSGYVPKALLGAFSREKREGFGPAESRGEGRLGSIELDIFERYQSALARSDAVDFDDLLLIVTRIAESETPEGVELRGRFSYALVDEFQDTNWIQYRLVRALSRAGRNLCVVGDDDQSIYRWRGADVRLIRNFRKDFPDAMVVKLEQNYRSTRNIVEAALGVIQPAGEREPKVLWTASDAGDPVRVRAVGDEREEATFVASSIRAELAQATLPDQIAVFYRVHAQSRALEEALRSLNVPYQIVGGMKFFERAEVKDLLAYLRLMVNPKSDTDLLRIINVPARGIGDKTVDKLLTVAGENTIGALEALSLLLEGDELGTQAKRKLAEFRALLGGLTLAGANLGPSALARRVLSASGYEDALRKEDNAEADARLGNLEELVGAIAQYEQEVEMQGETPTLTGYLERITLIANSDLLDASRGISLMTVHSAKGLEFDAVFLTGMEETIFPYRGVDQTHGDSDAELDEERRLAYVAITRARKRLVITHAAVRQLFGRTHYLEPSRFLADIPKSVARREGAGSSAYGKARRFDGVSRYGSAPVPAWRASGRPVAVSLPPGTRIVERDPDCESDPGREVLVRPGTRVRHRTFGSGVVEAVEGGDSPIIVARFRSVGTKRIKPEYLQFE